MATTISINLDNATIRDLRLFDRWESGDVEIDELLAFLARVVDLSESDVDDLEDLPITEMGTIMLKITTAMQAITTGAAEKN